MIDLLLEGFIHISEIGEDYFVYEEELIRLRGNWQGTIYAPGNRLTVMLHSVNLISQETKWYIVQNQPQKPPQKAAPSKQKQKKPSKAVKNSKHKPAATIASIKRGIKDIKKEE